MTVPLKRWCAEEAIRQHVAPHAIYDRLVRGYYPWVSVKHVNKRVVNVAVGVGGLRKMKSWVAEQAAKEGVKSGAIYMRIARGWYQDVVFVGRGLRRSFVRVG